MTVRIKSNYRKEIVNTVSSIKNLGIEINNILEIGSHDGRDASYFQEVFNVNPNNVYIIEAHKEYSKAIAEQYPDYNVYNFAAWNKEGEMTFNAALKSDDGRSSLLERDIYKKDFEQYTIPTKTINNFLLELSLETIDLVKLDVEGATYEVLQGFQDSLKKIKFLQLETELAEIWKKQITTEKIFKYLSQSGFSCVWQYNVARIQNDSLWIQTRLLEETKK
tara:strand:- start:2710 stop:3372 length:663 start_codon:yes stop_codon:yes gene_type:complete